MPEGDSIERVRRALVPFLLDKQLVRAASRWPEVVRGLARATCCSLAAHGKHLLIGFDDTTFLRVHLGMTGSWHRYAPGERWRRPRAEMGLLLATSADVLVCFKAPEVERLTARERAHHRTLAALGPDVLADPFDLDAIIDRARQPGRAETAVGDLLLDQRVAAGIGNLFKCEALFAQRLSPWRRTATLDDASLRALFAAAARMLRDSVARGRTPRRVYRMRLCPACSGAIAVAPQGVRKTWWCPRCQAT